LLPIEVGCLSVVVQGIWHNLYRGIPFFGVERAVRSFPISLTVGSGLIFLITAAIFGFADKRIFKLANERDRRGITLHFVATLVGGLLMLGSLLLAALDQG
jgi:hypothetical protein